MDPSAASDVAPLLPFDDPRFIKSPYAALAAARDVAPLGWHSGLGMFVATSHAACSAVLRERRLGRIFIDREPQEEWETFNWLHADSILDSEPPKHTRLRRLVAGAFGRGHVARLAPRIEHLVAQLLEDARERVAGEGAVDLIDALAEPLPVLVISELLGFPDSERDRLRPWSQAIVRMYELNRTAEDDRAAQEACREFAEFVADLATHRAAHPGEDLLTDLVQARDGSDKLSTHELIATAVLLLNAGHEASVNGFGNGLHSLLTSALRHTDLSELDPEPLVEEMLRHDSPSQLFDRTATEDLQVAGVPIAEGQKVAALLGAANRDPAVFDDPDTFDPTRNPNSHLAFGLGIHFCIGAPLARLEMQTAARGLFATWPRLQLVAARPRETFVLRGLADLIVEPGPAPRGGRAGAAVGT
ncbi:MAG: cytochrome P450 [Actinomycetia bacterium]|nr:cytochrome P450 [Actinomycetes bacterium]